MNDKLQNNNTIHSVQLLESINHLTQLNKNINTELQVNNIKEGIQSTKKELKTNVYHNDVWNVFDKNISKVTSSDVIFDVKPQCFEKDTYLSLGYILKSTCLNLNTMSKSNLMHNEIKEECVDTVNINTSTEINYSNKNLSNNFFENKSNLDNDQNKNNLQPEVDKSLHQIQILDSSIKSSKTLNTTTTNLNIATSNLPENNQSNSAGLSYQLPTATIKRPPTRVKTKSSEPNSCVQLKKKKYNEDIIDLLDETLLWQENDVQLEENSIINNTDENTQERIQEINSVSDFKFNNRFLEEANSIVKKQLTVQNVPCFNPCLELNTSPLKHIVLERTSEKEDSSHDLQVFEKICYNFLKFGFCKFRKFCVYSHKCPTDIKNMLENMDQETLLNLYSKYICKNKFFFEYTFSYVVTVFSKLNNFKQLLQMMIDIKELNIENNKFSYLNRIVMSLNNILKDVRVVIEKTFELVKEPDLNIVDALFDLLLQLGSYESNWIYIKTLCKVKGYEMDIKHIEMILQDCCQKDKPSRCYVFNIYYDIMNRIADINLKKISANIINHFFIILKDVSLHTEFSLLQKKRNQVLQTKSSTIISNISLKTSESTICVPLIQKYFNSAEGTIKHFNFNLPNSKQSGSNSSNNSETAFNNNLLHKSFSPIVDVPNSNTVKNCKIPSLFDINPSNYCNTTFNNNSLHKSFPSIVDVPNSNTVHNYKVPSLLESKMYIGECTETAKLSNVQIKNSTNICFNAKSCDIVKTDFIKEELDRKEISDYVCKALLNGNKEILSTILKTCKDIDKSTSLNVVCQLITNKTELDRIFNLLLNITDKNKKYVKVFENIINQLSLYLLMMYISQKESACAYNVFKKMYYKSGLDFLSAEMVEFSYSTVKRHFMSCKLLMEFEDYETAFNILVLKGFLLKKSNWVIKSTLESDINLRNVLFCQFAESVITDNIYFAIFVFKQLCIYVHCDVDVKSFFNNLIVNILNRNLEVEVQIKQFLILDVKNYLDKLEPLVLRALFLSVFVSLDNKLETENVYNYCSSINIYPIYMWPNRQLKITSDLHTEEIRFIIHYYFESFRTNLKVQVEILITKCNILNLLTSVTVPNILNTVDVTIRATRKRIICVLEDMQCKYFININNSLSTETLIVIDCIINK